MVQLPEELHALESSLFETQTAYIKQIVFSEVFLRSLNSALQYHDQFHQSQDFCHPLRRKMLFLFLHQMKLPLQKSCQIRSFNPHMHKMGPWVPKHYIFADHFYSKNATKLRFHVFLHFNSRKHMISTYISRELDGIHKKLWICSNLSSTPVDPQLEQNLQFLVNSVHFRWNDGAIYFLTQITRNT